MKEQYVPFCSNMRDGVNYRMPQSGRNRMIAFRREEVMQAVPRIANLFKEFLLKIASSQFKIIYLAVSEGSIVR